MSSTLMPPPPSPLAHRRSRANTSSFSLSFPHSPDSSCTHRKMSLSKGATFHESSSPPSEDDPVLSIRHLARRSPTCPRSTLQSLISDKEDVALKSIQAFEQTFSGARGKRLSSHRLPDPEQQLKIYRAVSSPSDEGLGSSISPKSDLARSFDRILDLVSDRDSGLGSSIDDHLSAKELDNKLRRTSEADGLVEHLIQDADHPDSTPVHTELQGGNSSRSVATSTTRSAVTHSISPPSSHNTRRRHHLSNFAHKKISQNILEPILREDRFHDFHPLVNTIGARSNKSIRCLRDLEQSLISEPLSQLAITHHLYRTFGEFSIQLVLDTYQHLSEADQRRNTDRPYDSGYFLDLVQQVGRLAAQIGSARQTRASNRSEEAESDDDTEYSAADEITLEGGLGQTGEMAELVRWKNGKGTSLRTNQPYVPVPGIKRQHSNEVLDDDVARSMARRKKNAEPRIVELKCSDKTCGKTFSRKCDLAKHEKTHSRPFKCAEPTCKYHDLGLPTEKERDRHYNDKHASNPLFYQCNYCEFKTKRESNCKQHMEKKHNWEYERVKGNGKKIKTTPGATPQTPSMGYSPSEQSPAPSHYWDDGSSVHGSVADSTMVSPFDQPMQNFDPYPVQVPSGMPLFPRPDQQRQFVQATPDYGFETMGANPTFQNTPQYRGFPVPINTQHMSPVMMRTPITPAYSSISSYGPSPQRMSIQMDYQGTGSQWETGLPTPNSNFLQPHSRNPSISYESPIVLPGQDFAMNEPMLPGMAQDPYISHSQLPANDDFSFNDPIVTTSGYQPNIAGGSLFADGTDDNYGYEDETMGGDTEWDQFVNGD